jgi:hypothetical protein
MGDCRTAGTGAESYAVDFNHYPAAAGYTKPSGLTVPPAATFGKVGSGFNQQMAPTYIRLLPLKDGWNSWFLYGSDTKQDYAIVSYGKDGTVDGTIVYGETTNFNNDIIFIDGQFVQYPAGSQH